MSQGIDVGQPTASWQAAAVEAKPSQFVHTGRGQIVRQVSERSHHP